MLTRRRFVQSTALAGAALLVGFRLDGRLAVADDVFAPNAFVRIASDNTVTIIGKHLEMGQGTYTGLAVILAEELDADWSQMRVEAAPADATRYNNLRWGPVQGTGGSTGLANSWGQLRRAGATARAMLVEAAARDWSVPAAEITVDRGVVSHAPSGRRATFGDLAAKAATLTPPPLVTLKDPKDFKLVGTHLPRLDGTAKTDGSAKFTMDFTLPGMLTALIARPPRFGATVKSFDATVAKQIKGVTHVVQVPSGVAVVATSFWAARKPGDARAARGRHRRRAPPRDAGARSGLRVPVSRARAHGAARRRRPCGRRRLRLLGRFAGSNDRPAGRREHPGLAADQGAGQHAARGRQLWAPGHAER